MTRSERGGATARLAAAALVLLALAAVLGGCGGASDGTAPETRPADFAITYSWHEGSVAPEFYSEYEITVGPGTEGEIRYTPTRPADGVPVWERSFTLTRAQLDDLYDLAATDDVFREGWERRDEVLVGGPSESATVVADGRRYEIPQDLTDGELASIAGLYPAITELVPQAVWDELEAERDAYIAETFDR